MYHQYYGNRKADVMDSNKLAEETQRFAFKLGSPRVIVIATESDNHNVPVMSFYGKNDNDKAACVMFRDAILAALNGDARTAPEPLPLPSLKLVEEVPLPPQNLPPLYHRSMELSKTRFLDDLLHRNEVSARDPDTGEVYDAVPEPYYYGPLQWLWKAITLWRDGYGRPAARLPVNEWFDKDI